MSDTGRYNTSPRSQAGGISRPIGDRHYDVQQHTGYATSTVSRGQWVRGQIVRAETPVLAANPHGLFMYDPTQPANWNHPPN